MASELQERQPQPDDVYVMVYIDQNPSKQLKLATHINGVDDTRIRVTNSNNEKFWILDLQEFVVACDKLQQATA